MKTKTTEGPRADIEVLPRPVFIGSLGKNYPDLSALNDLPAGWSRTIWPVPSKIV
jgi:hypothetical protein